MMTGLELKPSKMVARVINVNPLDAMRQPPLELTLIDGTTSTIAINYDSCGAPSDAMSEVPWNLHCH
jgi:hypothetical protein